MNWVKLKIDNVALVGDGAHASIKRVEHGVPYLTSKNFDLNGLKLEKLDFISTSDYNKHFKESDKAITKPKENDLLLSIIGTMGAPYLIPKNFEFGLSSSVSIVRPNLKIVDPEFLLYWIKGEYFQKSIQSIKSGVAQSFLSLSMIRSLPVWLPPLPVQQKIASILSAYDDLIENNLKRIKLLEEQAQLTYEEWFVRMKFPGHESTPINPETGLPEGWEYVKLGSKLEISSSKRIFLSDYVDEGIPFYRGKEIILKSKNEELSDRLYISFDKYQEITKRYGVPHTGDLLITAVGTLGFPYRVTNSDGDFYFKDGNLIWFKKSELISSVYLVSCFKGKYFKALLENIAIGSSQKALTIKALKDVRVLLPSRVVMDEFDNISEPLLDAIENLQNQNQLLKEARDILLPRLMSGMIEV